MMGRLPIWNDAFNNIVPKIKVADCIVFALPLYFWPLSSRIKAFIESFFIWRRKIPILHWADMKGIRLRALLMTSADNFFWTFEQAVSYYQITMVNYIGFRDRGMVLAGGCGDKNGKPQID